MHNLLLGGSNFVNALSNLVVAVKQFTIDKGVYDDDKDEKVFDAVYEISSAKPTIEHKEPIVVGFFILQYAKLRMLELYYDFFVKFCDPNLYEEIEMDTDSLYLALGRQTLEECIRPEMKNEWEKLRANDCRDDFKADNLGNFFPRQCCTKHTKYDKRLPGLFKEEYRGTEMIALCSKTYCCYNSVTDKVKFSSKGINKNHLEEPLKKFRRVIKEQVNVSSTNRGFRTVDNMVKTYEQTKKGLAYFYPKRKVSEDGIHTTPLDI